MDCIIIHYSEIGLKGKNRPFFEKKLVSNIKIMTGLTPKRESGRLVTNYDKDKIKKLKNIPGIAYYSPALTAKLNLEDFTKKALELVKKGTFRITTKRSNKSFKLNSMRVNKKVGEALFKKGYKVDLEKPGTEIFIEIGDKNAYLYTKKQKGLGGLPIGSTGKLVSLISGGIDSPVACYEMMRRGCELVIIHFYNNKEGVKDKILSLAKTLSTYQGSVKAYLIPFLELQKQVIMNIPSDYRMIIYRRLMFKIGNQILKQEKALGFVTGDNVGQVASQTLENLKVIWDAASDNVYAPLISKDKEEIINQAKKIRTYKTSIKPYSDCCSYLIAKHPVTRADLEKVKALEKKLVIKKLIKKALENKELCKIKS
jgi:thiamine biosynthesis protein ThiI